ncbi:MAG: pallilysin-related adhesin [Spirochaetes bacterium]|nr:pallilysin-related adhesin [Spirochaetota bacterium]
MATTLLLALLSACSQPSESTEDTSIRRPQYIVPEAASGIVLSSSGRPGVSITEPEESTNIRVHLPADYNPSQAIDANLDVDQQDEQIVVFKRRDDETDRVRVLVADFDSIRNAYVPAWKGETQANNVRTFSIQTRDLTGDHSPEIVAIGTDNEGRQTIDVFRRGTATNSFGLSYESVASYRTDASIEIEVVERSGAYESAQTAGASFPIAVYRRDVESENVLDLVKTTYYWRPEEESYVQGSVEDVPGTQIAEEQLARLYSGDVEDFRNHLSGPWFQTVQSEDTQFTNIVHFDAAANRIALHRDTRQESYDWINSYKTIYRAGPGLWINARNENLTSVRRNFSVAVTGLDTILVTVDEAEGWDGTYSRLTGGLQRTMVQQPEEAAPEPDFTLSGLYRNESGTEIFFSPPQFTMRGEDRGEMRGGFALYLLDRPVLQLKVLTENGLVKERYTYAVRFTEEQSGERIVRTLELQPAEIRIAGIQLSGEESLKLQQIEEIEDENGNEETEQAAANDSGSGT